MALHTKSVLIILIVLICGIERIFTKNVNEKDTKKKEIVGISVNGMFHEEKVLINGINRPYQLSYYKNKGGKEVLYFSYNVGLENESTFEIGYSEEGYPVPVPVTEVKNGFATAVNREQDLIYLGGSEGIYVHNFTASTSNNHTHLIVPKHNIWDLFYKDSLYFINFPSRRLYKHHSGHTELHKSIHEKIYHFVIDGDGDTFISNKTGLYMIRNNSKHRIHLKGAKVFRAFAVNRKGVAHFCGQNEIYVANKKEHKLHEILKVKNVFGLAFDDDDNMIYSDPHQIVRIERKDVSVETIVKELQPNPPPVIKEKIVNIK